MSADVLIGGRPAWRALRDLHHCPLSQGTQPHFGGRVSQGSATVTINGVPAARQGDLIVEAGPPNAILRGAPSVLMG